MWRMVEGMGPLSTEFRAVHHLPSGISQLLKKKNNFTLTSIIQLLGQEYDFCQNPFPLVLPKSLKKIGKIKTLNLVSHGLTCLLGCRKNAIPNLEVGGLCEKAFIRSLRKFS